MGLPVPASVADRGGSTPPVLKRRATALAAGADRLARRGAAAVAARVAAAAAWDLGEPELLEPGHAARNAAFRAASPLWGSDYLADLGDGVLDFDAHTWPQARCVAPSAASAAASVVGRLHRADAAWRVFRSIAGVAVDFPEARRNERHRGAADHRRRRAPTASLLDGAMWDAFCRHYRRDYRCLGFDPPPACASRWGGPA